LITDERRLVAAATKGFMPDNEAEALHEAALIAATTKPGLPIVEVGTYCGKSTVWLGAAAEEMNTVVFTVDHHHGSEENQSGWFHHDRDVVDEVSGRMETLPFFRRAVEQAGLERSVFAVVGESALVARYWTINAAMVFIDGGHGVEPARADYAGWTPHVAVGGLLAIHDVFPDPDDGGRPPFEEIYLPALATGRFVEVSACGSLRVLRRLA
jgi:MMP 1-O-methyltransferase